MHIGHLSAGLSLQRQANSHEPDSITISLQEAREPKAYDNLDQ